MKKHRRLALGLLAALSLFAASGQGTASANENGEPSPSWVTQLPEAQDAQQLLVVAAYDLSTAWVSLHEREEDGSWRMLMTTPGFIGREGLGKTQEGDGKTPVGCFGFDAAFGIAPDPGCALPYVQVDEYSYWSGDEREGMRYNELVDIRDLPELDLSRSEHLIDAVSSYQYCLNISYNPDGVPGLGSAIFLHCLSPNRPFTSGCVAIPEEQMRLVMHLVREDCLVRIDSLENLGGSF